MRNTAVVSKSISKYKVVKWKIHSMYAISMCVKWKGHEAALNSSHIT